MPVTGCVCGGGGRLNYPGDGYIRPGRSALRDSPGGTAAAGSAHEIGTVRADCC